MMFNHLSNFLSQGPLRQTYQAVISEENYLHLFLFRRKQRKENENDFAKKALLILICWNLR